LRTFCLAPQTFVARWLWRIISHRLSCYEQGGPPNGTWLPAREMKVAVVGAQQRGAALRDASSILCAPCMWSPICWLVPVYRVPANYLREHHQDDDEHVHFDHSDDEELTIDHS
jgi:hypothetical protein